MTLDLLTTRVDRPSDSDRAGVDTPTREPVRLSGHRERGTAASANAKVLSRLDCIQIMSGRVAKGRTKPLYAALQGFMILDTLLTIRDEMA